MVDKKCEGCSLPRPEHVPSLKSVNPRPLLSIDEPPPALLLYPPSLPREPCERLGRRTGAIFDYFEVSTHIISGAYPRTAPFVPSSYLEPDDGGMTQRGNSKEAREERATRLTDRIVQLNTQQKDGHFPPDRGENRVLWNTVNRYRRLKKSTTTTRGVTLLLAHANGFPKEVG